jgi:hypothetical protein
MVSQAEEMADLTMALFAAITLLPVLIFPLPMPHTHRQESNDSGGAQKRKKTTTWKEVIRIPMEVLEEGQPRPHARVGSNPGSETWPPPPLPRKTGRTVVVLRLRGCIKTVRHEPPACSTMERSQALARRSTWVK